MVYIHSLCLAANDHSIYKSTAILIERIETTGVLQSPPLASYVNSKPKNCVICWLMKYVVCLAETMTCSQIFIITTT